MDYSDFEYEKNYVAQVAAKRHSSWDRYVQEHHVFGRFKKPSQIEALKRVWDRWNS
jgi:hypothetical protein